ncbi:Uncharacterized protein HZ326_14471 [Fusarium oxysporum f. sp. albedinis]|nr:Uncharacterized protein HZ326_14471 [Fusarium oxysporum f. sp. albedinis]
MAHSIASQRFSSAKEASYISRNKSANPPPNLERKRSPETRKKTKESSHSSLGQRSSKKRENRGKWMLGGMSCARILPDSRSHRGTPHPSAISWRVQAWHLSNFDELGVAGQK